jgi:PEP-CTERM/exosortase A-associated glycosyltransferase
MTRILHVLDHSIPLHSGYTFRTLSILREQRKLGWETFHLTSPKQINCEVPEEDVDGWHFYRTPPVGQFAEVPVLGQWALMKQLEKRLLEVAQKVRPDILHAHSPVLNAIPALRVGRRLGIPVVYEVRAFWEDAAVDHGTTTEGSLRYRLTRALETRALQRANHVFTICEGLRADIVARGIAANRVTVIPNAVDIESFDTGGQPDASLKARLGLTNASVIGFIGSFYAYEGLDLLLDALPQILVKLPDVRVLLVGGGPQDAALKAQALRLGLADKVVFAGRVPHTEVQRYYDLVDVLAYPRHSMRLTELVTPLKPLEAMAQGRLLVASDVGGHKELIHDGLTGMLFKAGSVDSLAKSITELVARRERWPALRLNARRFVEQERSWTASVANYSVVYDRLTESKPRLQVVMSGPLPPAVGGMASVLAALEASTLSERVDLTLFETGKTTASNRPLWQGVMARARLMIGWWKIIGRQTAPVVHIHTCSGLTFFLDGLLLLMSSLRGAPTVMHVHGAQFDVFLDGLSLPVAALARWISRRASIVVVLSPEWEERLVSRWPGARLRVVANGVTTRSKAVDVARPGAPRFVFMGNLGRRKGVHVLLQAAAAAREEWLLDLAGGEEEPGYAAVAAKEISRLGLGDRVRLLGPVVGKEKNELLETVQGFVLPSLAEGLPMALLEAMAMGLPAVVSAVGAMPEVVRQNVDGIVVPAEDPLALAAALDQLARAPEQRQRLGCSAAERCRSLYGIERMVNALMDVYAELPGYRI